MYNIAICAIVKNEARYFAEWLEYHKLVGVEHFYIYNNNIVDDGLLEICAAYHDCVTLIDWPLQADQQRQAYQDYIGKYSSNARWTAFIDGDEFIVYKGAGDLLGYLGASGDVNAFVMRWVIFGTNGHVTRPSGLVIENFTMTHSVSPNPHWKTICRAARIDAAKIDTPHDFPYTTDHPVVQAPTATLCIYHYMLRSEEDVLKKTSRGDAWSPTESEKKKRNSLASAQAYLKKYNNTDLYDGHMLQFAQELKLGLAAKGLLR